MTDYICTKCDYVGKRKAIKRGSGALELFLWLVLLIPGPFYTLWRIFNKKYQCPHCGEEVMIPADSVLGQRRLQNIESELSKEELKDIPDMWEKDRQEAKKKDKNNGGEEW